MTRLDLHDLEKTSPQLEENFADVLATILEMIGYATKAIARKRWKEYMARTLLGEEQKVEELRKRLERLVQAGSALVMEHINANVNTIMGQTAKMGVGVSQIETDTTQLKTDTTHIRSEVGDIKDSSRIIMDLIQQQHRTKHDNDIYNILRPSQPNTDKMEGIMRDRVAGTGSWLLSEPLFQSWLRRDEPLLWICGGPGCGKTFLASAVISLIQSSIAKGMDARHSSAIGFFFLTKNNTRVGGFHQALRDIAWQITRFDAKYTDHVASQCRSSIDIETLPSAWRKLFVSYYGSGSKRSLYLIIDGLDETEEDGDYGRGEFFKLLSDLQGAYFSADVLPSCVLRAGGA